MENSNKSQKTVRKVFLVYILPIIIFVLLCLTPLFFIPFSDRMDNELIQKMPIFNNISEPIGKLLKQESKSPFYMIFKTDKEIYQPYEPISISFALVDKTNGRIPITIEPEIIIKDRHGNIQKDILMRDKIIMKYLNEGQFYSLLWYPKNVDYTGQLDISVKFNTGIFDKYINNQISVEIEKPQVKQIFSNAYTFLTLDSKEEVANRRILSTEGKESDISKLGEWFKLLNNDAILMPIGITKTFEDKEKRYSVWDINKKKESEKFAREYKHKKLDIALWIQALELEGRNISHLNYRESKREDNIYTENSVVSLNDQTRFMDIKKLLEEYMKNNNVDYIGLSKVFFSDMYHRELFGEFIKIFPEDISNEIRNNAFNQWKSFKVVEYFRNMLYSINRSKPIFIMLDDKDLINNPEQLYMAYAIGVDFIMLNIDTPLSHLDKEWKYIEEKTRISEYIHNIVLSYTVDYDNFIMGESSALENWKNANLYMLNKYNFSSLRIQDFYRTMFGNRGVYPAYEWMLFSGVLIGDWKESKNSYAIKQTYVPNIGQIVSNIGLNIELENIILNDISNINVKLLPIFEYEKEQSNLLNIPILKAGEKFRTNIILSNISFNQGLLKKHTRFIGLSANYQDIDKQLFHRIQMLPLIDTQTEIDKIYSTDK